MASGVEKDLYYVAVKLLLRWGDSLLITHDIFGEWDLPGGRIHKNEFDKSLESVIKRKVIEKLGSEIQYSVGKPCVFFRVKREEYESKRLVRIFAIGYEANYIAGDIHLGRHHDKMEWVRIDSFKPELYFTGGWLLGVQEYLKQLKSD